MRKCLIPPLSPDKVAQLESIFKIFNKFCYYSLNLCDAIFKNQLISLADETFKAIKENSPMLRENALFSSLLYEIVSLVNSTMALRTVPHPLMYGLSGGN